jgi:hypothetical protein
MCRYFWNRRGDPSPNSVKCPIFFCVLFKLRHDEGVKERSFYLCKIQSFYYKKYVQCREIKKSTDFLRNLPKSSELIYRNVIRWVWQHCHTITMRRVFMLPRGLPFETCGGNGWIVVQLVKLSLKAES